MAATVFSVSYSDYSYAVFGDTKSIKEELKALGGKFNAHLKHEDSRRAGWIVSKNKQHQLDELIKKAGSGEIKASDGEEKGEKKEAKSEEKAAKKQEGVFVAQYTTKSIAVFGDSRDIKDKLKEMGGRYNRSLTYNDEKRPGWIFRVELKDSLEKLLSQKTIEKEADAPPKEKTEAEPPQKEEKSEGGKKGAAPFLVDYNEKSVAVFGDSRALKDKFKELGGKFNKALTHNGEKQVGWVFRKELKDSVEKLVSPNQTCKRKREDELAPPAKKVRKTDEEEKEEKDGDGDENEDEEIHLSQKED